MIVRSLCQFALLSVAAVGCWWLVSQFESLLVGAVLAALALVACIAGVVLLRTSEVGRVTWKNRVAGWLIPWGWRINSGKLWPAAVVSWVVWMLVWAAVTVLTPPGVEPLSAWDVATRILLGVAWMIDGLALGYLIGTLRQHFSTGSGGWSLRVITALLTTMIAVSVALHLFGLTTAGFLVAGGPPLLVGGGYGLFLAALLLFGRNSRWN